MEVFPKRWLPEVALTREFSATRLNEIMNHPEVRPWVSEGDAPLDAGPRINNFANHCLIGEHGGCLLVKLQPGIYEVHTQVLPEGRGEWAIKLIQAVSHYMFTRTDLVECLTRVPAENRAARMLTIKSGLRQEFNRKKEATRSGVVQDVDILSFRLADWVPRAPGLEEVGRDFHDWMHREGERLGTAVPWHEDDPNHNRYVGACIEMALNGQVAKSVNFYNRWANITRHPVVQMVASNPPIIKFDIGCLRLSEAGLTMFRNPQEALSWAASSK